MLIPRDFEEIVAMLNPPLDDKFLMSGKKVSPNIKYILSCRNFLSALYNNQNVILAKQDKFWIGKVPCVNEYYRIISLWHDKNETVLLGIFEYSEIKQKFQIPVDKIQIDWYRVKNVTNCSEGTNIIFELPENITFDTPKKSKQNPNFEAFFEAYGNTPPMRYKNLATVTITIKGFWV